MKCLCGSAVVFALASSAPDASSAGRSADSRPTDAVDIARLWRNPADLGRHAICSRARRSGADARSRDATFTFVAADQPDTARDMTSATLTASNGASSSGRRHRPRSWSSRILWAIGYHQPPTYYVAVVDDDRRRVRSQAPGRIPAGAADRKVVGDWSWYENHVRRTPSRSRGSSSPTSC